MSSLYDIEVRTIEGATTTLAEFADRVVLIVNTASQCGFTPQFEGLEQLHREYGPRGLVVLGFPCNQFGKQDPGSDEEIDQFAKERYDVSFRMHSKVEVNGQGAHPLFGHLKQAAPGLFGSKSIKWNFTKFLVGPGGRPIERYGSKDSPARLRKRIEKLLEGVAAQRSASTVSATKATP